MIPTPPESGLRDACLRGPEPGDPARPLKPGQFRLISMRGFGDGMNSYPYGYRWFKDHLLLGTNRNLLLIAKQRFRWGLPFDPWPTDVPEGPPDPEDMRAEIWRYNPRTDHWTRSYQSTIVPGIEGPQQPIPLATGFRNMALFQGKSDSEPCVYTIPNCSSYGVGVVLMRSEDGITFEQVSEQGMGLGDPNIIAFRGLIPFKGKLFATPGGSRGFDPNVSYNATVICSDDPVQSNWQKSSPPSFGDSTNLSIFELGATDTHIYAGTINIREGCQLWKSDGEGPPPHKWTKVFDRGAGRGPFNQGVVCMMPFRGALYVGTGIQNGGFDRLNSIGPAAAEVLRVWPDDSFDLIAADPRLTPWGFKTPISGYGAGFDNPFAGYMWRCGVHDGTIYFGNYDSTAFIHYVNNLEPHHRKLLDPDTIERFLDFRGGFEVWCSVDGERWTPVTRNGFGNRYNFGVRTMIGTPAGFFIGGANPFGPKVAVRKGDRWQYEQNPRGGCEIFFGSHDHLGEDIAPPPIEVRTRAVSTTLREFEERDPEKGRDDDGAPAPLVSHLNEVMESVASIDGSTSHDLIAEIVAKIPIRHPESPEERHLRDLAERALDPTLRLAAEEDFGTMAGDVESEIEEYFSGDLRNAGLWLRGIDNPAAAAQALVEDLVAYMPEGPHTVLVVGEGVPAIARIYAAEREEALVHGLASDGETASMLTARGLGVVRSRGESPQLGRERYDALLWVEGPDRFGRQRALAEAARVLRPGGTLALADLARPASGDVVDDGTVSSAVAGYVADLEAAGFTDVRTSEVTRRGWERFFLNSRSHFLSKWLLGQIDDNRRDEVLRSLPGGSGNVAAQLMAKAIKGSSAKA